MHAPTVGTFCFHKIWMEMTVQKLKWIMLMCLAGILLHYYVKTSTAFQQQLSEESQQKSTKMGCESQKTRRSTYLQLKCLLEWALFLPHMYLVEVQEVSYAAVVVLLHFLKTIIGRWWGRRYVSKHVWNSSSPAPLGIGFPANAFLFSVDKNLISTQR